MPRLHKPRSVREAEVSGKRVLVRVDFNVPLEEGRVADDTRIRAALPTIQLLLEREAGELRLVSHLGRPKGEIKPELSLRPVATRLGELLGQPVGFPESAEGGIAGPAAQAAVAAAGAGSVVLLENLRFEAAETSKDDAERGAFADALAALAGAGGAYVGDGFGAVHRKHASVYDLPQRLPHAAGGLVLAGHSAADPAIVDALVQATDALADRFA